MGAETKYKPEYVEIARKLTKIGATMWQIAKYLEVHKDTVYEWTYKHPDFNDAIKMNRDEGNDCVKRSLFDRAMGYEYEEKKMESKDGVMVLSEIQKKVEQPNVNAMIFWLCNRDPDNWKRNRSDFDIPVDDQVTEIKVTRLSKTNNEIKRESKDES